MIDAIGADLPVAEAGRWFFPDQRPALVGFTDLMTAALEAVMVQQYLDRLQGAVVSNLR